MGVGHVLAGTPVAAAVGLKSLRAQGNVCLGLHSMRCHIGSRHRHDALNSALRQVFGAAGLFKSIEPVGVFAGVQDAHERPDHCLLADDGQDLFTDLSMVFANDRNVRVVVEEQERVKVNKYGQKCRRAGVYFQPLVLEARSGGMSKTTANISKKHAMLAVHRLCSDPMFLHRRWLQKLSIKVQVLNLNLVATCMPYGDAYYTRTETRNAGASVCFVFQSPDNPLDKRQIKGEGAEAGKGFPLPVLFCPPGHQRIRRRGVYIVFVRGLSPRRRDTKCKRRCRDDNPERVAW
jgi:hypothetical protein